MHTLYPPAHKYELLNRVHRWSTAGVCVYRFDVSNYVILRLRTAHFRLRTQLVWDIYCSALLLLYDL